MATVNLSWTVEGLHDGIRVTREFNGIVDYLDTLPAGSTEFEDDFSISELAEHYDTAPQYLILLTYTLTTFRGDKEKSTIVPVPVEDSDPEWLQDFDWPQSYGSMESVEVPILKSDYNAAIDTSQYGSEEPLKIYFADGNESYALQSWSADYSPYASDFDFTQLHDLNFTRMLNAQINNKGASPLLSDVIIGSGDYPFESESYVLDFYTQGDLPEYTLDFNHELFVTGDFLPEYYLLSAPYVSSDPGLNDYTTGMAINVYMTATGFEKVTTIPWTPVLQGTYVFVASVSVVYMPGAPV